MKFAGFPGAAFEFFAELELNNTKTFWLANKQVYEESVRAPMETLLRELAPEFGDGKVFRPYRDVRFSADKAPYKTNIAAVSERGGYISLGSDSMYAARGAYMLDGPDLKRFRAAAASDTSGPELERIVGALEKKGYEVGGEALKTSPQGYPRDHPRAKLLRHKGVTIHLEIPIGDAMDRSALALVRKVWRDAIPLGEWFAAHVY